MLSYLSLSTTLVYWASRAPPSGGRTQLLNRMPQYMRKSAYSLGNKMIPVCPAPSTGPPRDCIDYVPNYERFPRLVIKPTPTANDERDGCFALRFSIMSEAAAYAIEKVEQEPR